MKRSKNKNVWVKRMHLDKQTYDYISTELNKASHLIEFSANNTTGTKFVKPTFFDVVKIEIEQFFKQKKYEMVFAVIIIVLTVVIERLISKLFMW